jgi:hypothetical protein
MLPSPKWLFSFQCFHFQSVLSILKQVTSQVVRVYLSILFSFVEGKGLTPFVCVFLQHVKRSRTPFVFLKSWATSFFLKEKKS